MNTTINKTKSLLDAIIKSFCNFLDKPVFIPWRDCQGTKDDSKKDYQIKKETQRHIMGAVSGGNKTQETVNEQATLLSKNPT